MSSPNRPVGTLHLVALSLLVMLEFLQNGMVSFASSYISGGIGAAPEEFSLAAACYASVAVVMIFQHRWLVQRLGYRRFLQIALAFFALGAIICANADDVNQFIAGRMVEAVGCSAFFTAARIQLLHYRVKERGIALLAFGFGILLGSGLAPVIAAYLVDHGGWQGIFVVMLPIALTMAALVSKAVPDEEPVKHDGSAHHVGGFLLLAFGVFALQFALERTQYDIFSNPLHVALILLVALGVLGTFVAHDVNRVAPLVDYRRFVSGRYLTGLVAYCFTYIMGGISAFMTPIFLVRGLGFPLVSIGWLLSITSLSGVVAMLVLFRVMQQRPGVKKLFAAAFAALFVYGWWMSGMSEEISLQRLAMPLILHNGIFLSVVQFAAAIGTFRDVDETVFSNAYQVKNALREIAGSTGISIATVMLQSRSTLHYERLVESADPRGQLVNASGPVLAQFAAEVSRQATLMACQDYFFALCAVALLAAIAFLAQRKLV